jgi:hypothetical protein
MKNLHLSCEPENAVVSAIGFSIAPDVGRPKDFHENSLKQNHVLSFGLLAR